MFCSSISPAYCNRELSFYKTGERRSCYCLKGQGETKTNSSDNKDNRRHLWANFNFYEARLVCKDSVKQFRQIRERDGDGRGKGGKRLQEMVSGRGCSEAEGSRAEDKTHSNIEEHFAVSKRRHLADKLRAQDKHHRAHPTLRIVTRVPRAKKSMPRLSETPRLPVTGRVDSRGVSGR